MIEQAPPKLRQCRVCGVSKPLELFHASQQCKYGRRYTCRECIDDRYRPLRKHRQPVPEVPPGRAWCTHSQHEVALGDLVKVSQARGFGMCVECSRQVARRTNLAKHGLTVEEFDAMLERQGGMCAVPGCTETSSQSGAKLHVDHDHSCCPGTHGCRSCVRGLICHRHNAALGYTRDMRDGPALLEYLAAV